MSEQPMAFEEVPGSRTSQQAIDQPQRERIAYEDLQPGEIIQEGDEWQNECGRWRPFLVLDGSRVQVRQSQRVRRPYNITQLQDERDKWQRQFAAERSAREVAIAERNEAERLLAEARMERDKAWNDQKAIQAYRDTALQELGNAEQALSEERAAHAQARNDRDKLKTALCESHAAHEFTMKQGLAVCKERNEANAQIQNLLKTITDSADQFADTGKILEQQRDEARAELQRLQEVVGNLYNEPTARQVQNMLRTWATELDWSAGCFDSVGRDEIDTIQKTLIAVMERIETMIQPEGGSDDK